MHFAPRTPSYGASARPLVIQSTWRPPRPDYSRVLAFYSTINRSCSASPTPKVKPFLLDNAFRFSDSEFEDPEEDERFAIN